jgi:two-component system CheB/CheR fusion protein
MPTRQRRAKELEEDLELRAALTSSGHNAPGCSVVGIGASAGGLAAFEAFFSGMPAGTDPGMAFVLVQHLAPDHKSILTELVKRYTRMEVFEVADGMAVKPNCAYIIPPNRDMALLNGTLHLLEPAAPRGHRLPIDFFFRSLAQDQRERAIGIVLSGTGSDGTQGVRAIKGEGGMAMAQNPKSTEYDGMPTSAIATGLVDYVLPAAEMPAQLIAYVAHAFGKTSLPVSPPAPKAEDALKKIFLLLRAQTGHDFSQYKQSTIARRVERRMAVHQIERLDEYVRYLQQTPADVEALFRDLLIGVTSFFRDVEAFGALQEQAIPRLLADKPRGALIRVWVPGCSTGEEAYSIAILLQERMEELKQSFKLHVFATDIDRRAIECARAGIYPASIAGDISPERLARFFSQEPDGSAYRIQKGIRDSVIFSEQDVIKDPPFSKLDLISCRNLLIYMGGELQKKLIPLFHYALNPGGMLFLGTSETAGEFGDLFATVDRKSKLYQRREEVAGAHRTGFLSLLTEEGPVSRPSGKAPDGGKLPVRELTERALLEQYAPPGAVVNERGDIFYLHGRTGKYLEPAPGEAGMNVLKMAREGLRPALTTALHKAVALKAPVRHPGLRIKTNGDFTIVNLTVQPVPATPDSDVAVKLFLVIFEDAAVPAKQPSETVAVLDAGGEASENTTDFDARVATLRQELRAKEEYLQTTNEELATSNEELKSANEEMQSVNEELQSTNEELETSKEELQSVNEELATVNTELQNKVADLSRSNNDMNNLLAGTGIGTIFVDHQLRIQRFTPAVIQVINLILTDVGRPVGHIVSNLVGYDRLVADVREVLDSLVPKEFEVQTHTGAWYLLRIRPYRTLENVIEGAVITFTEITELKKAKAALREAEVLLRLAVVVRDAYDAITVQDLEGRILAWNPGAERMYGWSEAEALAMNICAVIPEDLREEALAVLRQQSRAEVIEPHRMRRIAKDGRIVDVWLTATALVNDSGGVYAIATTERKVQSEP